MIDFKAHIEEAWWSIRKFTSKLCCNRCRENKKVEVVPHEFVYLPGGGMGWRPVGSGLEKVQEHHFGWRG